MNPLPHTAIMNEVGEIIGMVGTQAMEGLSQSQENMAELLGKLEDLVNQRRKEIDYTYYWDYERRLCQNDEAFEKTLQEKVLYNSKKWLKIGKKQSEIGKLYFKIISLFPEDAQKLAKKRIQEEYLMDLVFESMEGDELEGGEEYKIQNQVGGDREENLEKYIEEIRKIRGSEIRSLNLWNNKSGKYLGTDGMIEFARALKRSRIRALNLSRNELGEHLGTDGIVEFVRALKGSEIRSLILWNNELGKHLGVDGMVKFAEALGGSGIQHLDIGNNELGEYLGTDGMIKFAEALEGSKIKSLGLGGEYPGLYGMIRFAKALEGSGIKSLKLGHHKLSVESLEVLEKKIPNIHFRY
ncbi:hypothetical protein CSB09_02535 [Candidatus Gracilibacteria bacterium]|nr:MAG: hypothetical protein CSB09_02535 [Candidatus Gracilibacteria bacterium]